MSATLMLWPTVTAVPASVRLPAVGRLETLTAIKALAGLSLVSVNPKSVAAKTQAESSFVVSVVLAPDGASLTDVMLTVVVPCAVSAPPLPWADVLPSLKVQRICMLAGGE